MSTRFDDIDLAEHINTVPDSELDHSIHLVRHLVESSGGPSAAGRAVTAQRLDIPALITAVRAEHPDAADRFDQLPAGDQEQLALFKYALSLPTKRDTDLEFLRQMAETGDAEAGEVLAATERRSSNNES